MSLRVFPGSLFYFPLNVEKEGGVGRAGVPRATGWNPADLSIVFQLLAQTVSNLRSSGMVGNVNVQLRVTSSRHPIERTTQGYV